LKTYAVAVSAKHLEKTVQEQERLARLESKVDHIESVVTELKADSRALSAKIDNLKDAISSIHTSRARSTSCGG
jgi:hypothetical protein